MAAQAEDEDNIAEQRRQHGKRVRYGEVIQVSVDEQEDLMTSWWRHQMDTFSALLALCAGNSPVTGEFPSQRPVTRSFDVFFDLRLEWTVE